MKRYRIELSETQMRLVANCLEDISRFASGQYELRHTIDEILVELPIAERLEIRNTVEKHLEEARKILFPDLHTNASLGYNSTEFIGNTYQIYRTILYRLATDNEWGNVYSSPALPSGSMGTIKIEQIKESDNERTTS